MKSIIHKANTRGNSNYGWLDSYHTFSFGNYHNPERMHFGLLRVLNDDFVEGGKGFDMHPHQNMEIISIPLSGDLEHKDSMGNVQVIKENDVQIMSAGSGIYHSEYNKNIDKPVNFLQIWIFPKIKNISPRYEQKTFLPDKRKNNLLKLVSPENDDALYINQDAWIYISNFDKDFKTKYVVNKKGNGVYIFIINGEININNNKLLKRDGIGIWDIDCFTVTASKNSELLFIEVPMTV